MQHALCNIFFLQRIYVPNVACVFPASAHYASPLNIQRSTLKMKATIWRTIRNDEVALYLYHNMSPFCICIFLNDKS